MRAEGRRSCRDARLGLRLWTSPLSVSSQSGTDYSFFVEKKGEGCLLHLNGKQKGFTRYTNNLTYIRTKELSG